MREEDDVEKFYQEILFEVSYLEMLVNKQELPYWLGIRDALRWVLGGDDFVYRDELELNKSAVGDNG